MGNSCRKTVLSLQFYEADAQLDGVWLPGHGLLNSLKLHGEHVKTVIAIFRPSSNQVKEWISEDCHPGRPPRGAPLWENLGLSRFTALI
jgi:hypothetical protein